MDLALGFETSPRKVRRTENDITVAGRGKKTPFLQLDCLVPSSPLAKK
jgi:hypothetical protein